MPNRFYAKSRKLMISILAIIAMVITSISFVSMQNNAYAETDAAQVGSYTISVPSGEALPDNVSQSTKVNPIDSSCSTLTTGWYVVEDDVTIDNRIEIDGNVNIILGDDNTLNATQGIQVSGKGNSITIWCEMGGTGELIATAYEGNAAIGGDSGMSGDNITINGGIITGTTEAEEDFGNYGAAAIGGGSYGLGNNITINGGVITATGSAGGSGIGGGCHGSASHITINDGNVTSKGGYNDYFFGGAGIGSGEDARSAVDITINSGEVTAIGVDGGAGIGGGYYTEASNITINGGIISAAAYIGDGEVCGAGIGSGYAADCCNIYIYGGNITAQTSINANGIGHGSPDYYYLEPEDAAEEGEIVYEDITVSDIIISSALHVEGGKDSSSVETIVSDTDDYTSLLSPAISTDGNNVPYVRIYLNDDWNNSTTPESTSIKSLKAYKKSIKVTWTKKSDITGYQVRYGRSGSYKTVTVKSANTVTKTIKNLKSKKRYYVKVRTYSGTTSNCSSWSKVKSVKTK